MVWGKTEYYQKRRQTLSLTFFTSSCLFFLLLCSLTLLSSRSIHLFDTTYFGRLFYVEKIGLKVRNRSSSNSPHQISNFVLKFPLSLLPLAEAIDLENSKKGRSKRMTVVASESNNGDGEDIPKNSCSSSSAIEASDASLKASNAIDFLRTVGRLKELKRTGWVNNNIEKPESVADHMYRMSMASFLITDPGIDKNRLMRIAIVHDLAESIVGDIVPHDRRYTKEDKYNDRAKEEKTKCHYFEPLFLRERNERPARITLMIQKKILNRTRGTFSVTVTVSECFALVSFG